MSPKKGDFFPGRDDRENDAADCAATVASALQSELGSSHRAAKTLMRWTGASERTVKHWLTGRHAPRSDYLIVLLRRSDAVFESLMIAADRSDAAIAAHILSVQIALDKLLVLVTGQGSMSDISARTMIGGDASGRVTRSKGAERDRTNDLELDPEAPKDRAVRPSYERELPPRQRWYLTALRSGLDVRAADLKKYWGVSDKTARRDLAALMALEVIGFKGSCRAGRYYVKS